MVVMFWILLHPLWQIRFIRKTIAGTWYRVQFPDIIGIFPAEIRWYRRKQDIPMCWNYHSFKY